MKGTLNSRRIRIFKKARRKVERKKKTRKTKTGENPQAGVFSGRKIAAPKSHNSTKGGQIA